MILGSKPITFLAGLLVVVSLPCRVERAQNRVDEKRLPPIILWAWERPEDLRFLTSSRHGVAFLAQTLVLKADDVIHKPRRQPLRLSPATRAIAVTRIESLKTTGERPSLSQAQKTKLVNLINETLKLPAVWAIQIDFDAVTSERVFYRSLLEELRSKLPDDTPLSITALASFCVGDRWIQNLPVDEAIPMAFRMGTDSQKIKSLIADGHDFRGELCQRSYGIALDEPLKADLEDSRRVYVFNSRSWTPEDLQLLEARLKK
ncbi:MAG TPA: hypothetical protein VF074_10985 [Pyrinomonadaceae bacterium]